MKILQKREPTGPDLLEYKLDYTPDLRCEKQNDLVPVCHSCKSCILAWKIFATREWFTRASSATQRQFIVGIIKRFRNQELLKYTWNLLKPTNGKDFIYSRSSVTSSFQSSSTSDRALNLRTLEQSMSDLWKWFLNASFWSKANYTLLLLQMSSSELLLMAASLIRILLAKDAKTTAKNVTMDKAKTKEEQLSVQQKSVSLALNDLPSHFPGSSAFGSYLSSEKTRIFARPCIRRVWSFDSDLLSESEDESDPLLVSPGLTIALPCSKKVIVHVDFIRSLPIHLSKCILRMMDSKSLTQCFRVSSHWAFLVKEIRQDVRAYRALRTEIIFFQGLCPKGAIANYARMVKVAIPQINKDGEIIPMKGYKDKEEGYMHEAYHGQLTNNVSLEEKNVFCSSYNVRVLIESVDPGRVIHYSGGKLVAFGSMDRKIHFLNVNGGKEVRSLSGHSGRIHAIYLNEKKGFLLSGSFDLSIRMWNISNGECVKSFMGHKGSIISLDVYKNRFVSGSKDCTAKLWNIESGKCLKTFRHKGIVWAAKMNDIHIVSCCDRGTVKVWHLQTCLLIKILEGHLGPVRCLSFDHWHLVTGSNDGYVLGWSMLGKHKRCLMAFRHPMEVLYLEFLYLRVISGCADGKIRIFNFLTGACLRVMRANSRGDPVVSICIAENRLLINAQGTVVLFQFESVDWDYSLGTDRVIKKRDKSEFDDTPFTTKSSPHSLQKWKKIVKKKNWKLYKPEDTMLSYYISKRSTKGPIGIPGLYYEMVKVPCSRTSPYMRRNIGSQDIPLTERKRLFYLAKTKQKKNDLTESESVSTLKGSSDDASEQESLVPTSFLARNSEALLKHMKMRNAATPTAKDQALLAISTMHHAYKADQVSANMAFNMKVKDAWGPTQLKPKQTPKDQLKQTPQSQKQQDMAPSAQLKQLKAAGGLLGFNRISTPYETKTLQLNLKNSLLGDNVQSFIPAPSITRSKSCSNLLEETKMHSGQARIPSPPVGGRQLIGFFTSSNESIKVPQMKIAQPNVEAVTQRKKFVATCMPNPYRLNAGFRLLTPQQMKEYEEAKVSEYQANQTKVIADRQKECKRAWLRKIKGLPIDAFTKEGKIAAPELGENVFI